MKARARRGAVVKLKPTGPSSPCQRSAHDDSNNWESFLPDPALLLDPEHTELWLTIALVWLLVALLNELMELRLSDISWRRDVTNFAEAPMFILATLAVGSRLGLGNAIAEWANMTRLAPSLNIPIWSLVHS